MMLLKSCRIGLKIMSELWLSKQIYEKKYILHTISTYEDICKIVIYEEADKWICNFEKSKYDLELTIREFENYLIALSNRGENNANI